MKESEELVLLLSRIDAAEDQYQVQDVLKSAYLKDRLNIESIIVRAKGRLKELTGLSFKPALLKSFLPKADDKSIVGFTEDANAVRFIERYKGLVRYVVDQDKWLEFVGYYKEQTQKEVLEYARQTIAVLLDDMKRNGASAAEIAKVGMLFQKAAMYKHMLEIAAGDVAIAVRDEDLNTLTRYVAVQNGELDLKKVEFIPADPEHFITQCMGVAYDPKAECPIFKKVLSDAFYGDERMIKYFLRCVAYALLGDPVEQKYFTLLGGGANGKSTLINGILNVFGDYGDVTEASTVMGDTRSQGGQSREDLVRLKDKRLVVTMEPENNMPIKSGTVKALTGGEKIAARAMYKKTNTFQPRLTLFICANEELILRGSDYGLTRRESIIPFNKRFSEEERDKSFPAKLRAEGSGILNLILEALKDYYEVGLNPPEEVKTATQEHIDSQDILAEWLEDNFEFGPEYTVTTIAAFSNWKTYAEPRGLDGIVRNTRSLGKQLSGKGFRAIRNSYNIRGRGFLGLRLKDPEMNID
jgi:putative DNA primase/helicase